MAIPTFALHELGWQAFQQFCHTVLREVLGQQVMAFLDTDDAGRDGAFAGIWAATTAGPFDTTLQGEFVVQCKHTSRAGANLSASDFADELEKAERLVEQQRCDVYILMTNAGLTARTEAQLTADLKRRGVKQVLVLGSTWLNQTVVESSRLRRLVPRLYGLGDLTQILDQRAYDQARAVLDAMRTDLDKLVMTGTYDRAARALGDRGFVLLTGAAATGKTTIAAQLALGSADEFDTAVVKLERIDRLENRWSHHEPQLFWLDDAFGPTQYDRTLAWAWVRSTPMIAAALKAGSRFVVTTRDYIFRTAYRDLKPGSFPLLHASEVVVDVSDLSPAEEEQILYNHLRLGRQPNTFLETLSPHLELAANHPGFTPELARRLADPLFTPRLHPDSAHSVDTFFAHPRQFLTEVMEGVDDGARAALGLIFINQNWLPIPVTLTSDDADFLARLGSDLGAVTRALEALDGGMVNNIVREGAAGWTFSHPTMVEAYADLLRSPDLQRHLLSGFPLEVVMRQFTCGDVGIEGAVVIQPNLFDAVLDRLDEPVPPGEDRWREDDRRNLFLASRCDRDFLSLWLTRRGADYLDHLYLGLMLESDSDNDLTARLNQVGLLPERHRARIAADLVDFCVTGYDPAVLWNETLRTLLTNSEWETLLQRVRAELLPNPGSVVRRRTEDWRDDSDPQYEVEPLVNLVNQLPVLFPDDDEVARYGQELSSEIEDWVSSRDWSDTERKTQPSWRTRDSVAPTGPSRDRSIFDDLTEGRRD